MGDASYQPDQLVVDVQHLGAVKDLLHGLGVVCAGAVEDDHDDALGLTLLRDLRDGAGDPLDVGDVLALLRQRAAAERDGWVPTIGKNRMIDAIIGESHKPMFVGIESHKPMSVGIESHKPMSVAGSTDPIPVPASEVPAPVGGPEAGRGVRVGVVDTLPAPARGPAPFRSGHALFVESLIRRYAPAADVVFEGALDGVTGRTDSWSTARAMLRLASAQPLDVLNLSFGCFTAAGGPPLVIARAVERIGTGVLIVAAAGNHGATAGLVRGRNKDSACWPAAIPPVVAVGAADDNGVRAPWSPDRPWVTCLAPGVDVVGSYLTGPVQLADGVVPFTGQARWSGTSFAAAVVSGAVAGGTVPGEVAARAAFETRLAKGDLLRPAH